MPAKRPSLYQRMFYKSLRYRCFLHVASENAALTQGRTDAFEASYEQARRSSRVTPMCVPRVVCENRVRRPGAQAHRRPRRSAIFGPGLDTEPRRIAKAAVPSRPLWGMPPARGAHSGLGWYDRLGAAGWCNGSTGAFGAFGRGSNPCPAASAARTGRLTAQRPAAARDRLRSFPPGASTMSCTSRSVMRGSSPSVCPLSSRTTSAMSRPPAAFG